MSGTETSHTALLMNSPPLIRSSGVVWPATLRRVAETFTEVPDGRDTAHALPVAGPHPRSELTGAAPSSRVRANTRSGHRERGGSRQRSDTTGRASEREARQVVVL